MDWLRWYQGTVTDPKWRFVSAESGATGAEVIAVWACMVEHANKAEPRGTLTGWRDKVYAMMLDMAPERVQGIREAMQELVLNGEKIAAWEKRQPSDHSTERVRRFREVKRDETVGNGVKRNETPGNTEEKRREEKRITTTDGAAVAANPIGDPKVVDMARKRAAQLPGSWEPDASHREMAERFDVDLAAELEQFRDYHAAKGSAMKDWDAAFRTWLRNAKKFGARKVSGSPESITLDGGVWG